MMASRLKIWEVNCVPCHCTRMYPMALMCLFPLSGEYVASFPHVLESSCRPPVQLKQFTLYLLSYVVLLLARREVTDCEEDNNAILKSERIENTWKITTLKEAPRRGPKQLTAREHLQWNKLQIASASWKMIDVGKYFLCCWTCGKLIVMILHRYYLLSLFNTTRIFLLAF